MYAVIATGGKQYRVAEGDVVRIEKLTAEPGAAVEFDKVLVVGEGSGVKVGTPYVVGRQGHRHRAGARQGRQGTDRQVPPPQALPASGHAPAAVYRSQDHRHPGRLSPGRKESFHGTQESRRQYQERPRFAEQAPRAQEVRRRAGAGRQHPRPSARHRCIGPATTSASAPITRCSRCRTASCGIKRKGVGQRVHVSVDPQG